jgi:multisubunit Na+/H+ antiporter MnhB subunit
MKESNEYVTGLPLAITGVVCGLTACTLALTPLLALQAMLLGAAGVMFGLISRKHVPVRSIQRRLAKSAIILGCLAVGFAMTAFGIANYN